MPLLSIIIPVYNVEHYLEDCLKSILSQLFQDYEVILVNNASTDSSGSICSKYAEQYSCIRTVHLERNVLPAGARNVGLEISQGDYVHFCDSDDYYTEGSLQLLADLLNQRGPSVVMGQFLCVPEKGAYVTSDVDLNSEIIEKGNSSNISEYLLSLPQLLCTPWRLVVKRDVLITNDIKFPEGIHSEDEEWFPKVICCSDTFAHLPVPFYCYRPRAVGSITSSKSFINSKSHLVVALNLIRFLLNKKYTDRRKKLIESRITFLLGLFSTRCDTFTRSEIAELAVILREELEPLTDVEESLYSSLFKLVSLFGATMGLQLYKTLVEEVTIGLVSTHEGKDIYVFPTGYNGEATARILKKQGYSVKGFLDNSVSKAGSELNELPVMLPSVLQEIPASNLENTFVIISTQQEKISSALMNQLRELGLKDSQFAKRIY
ncbi:glycosyltransferase family 2 protein [Paenibacillus massiliensis]|uniref:glycosyltransferase family 2 protein n=1 Tax=Paenibacillus massiliensis TaxID=225917 RepID=UPI000367703E|nr:glycosyltransferase family 2 protein [Paenibacillus massiliensis]